MRYFDRRMNRKMCLCVKVSTEQHGRALRVRRGLIDTAIDESIDKDKVNFLEVFKPFQSAINSVRYLIIKVIIYLR